MNKPFIALITITAMILCTGLASAQSAQPGTAIQLNLNSYQMTTSGLIITPSWQPAYIKWYLINPHGNKVYMVQSELDSVSKISSGFNTATWQINEASGSMQLPAFAEKGTWTVQGQIYDINRLFIFQFSNKAQFTGSTVEVVDYPFTANLMAPAYYIFFSFTNQFEFAFALPPLIFIFAGLIIIFLILLNWSAFRNRRKSNA